MNPIGNDPTGKWIHPAEYWEELISGRILGKSTSYVGGQNLAVQPGFPANIWYQGGLITWLTADTPLYASSTDVNDNQLIIVAGAKDTNEFTDGIAFLDGQNQALLDRELYRTETYFNIGPGPTLGDIYIAEQDALSGGVPVTASKIHMKIPAGLNLATQGSYTIKKDRVGYLCQVRGSVGKGKNAAIGVNTYSPFFELNYEAAPMRIYQGPFSFGDAGGIGSFGEGDTINPIVNTEDPATPVTINYRIVEKHLA